MSGSFFRNLYLPVLTKQEKSLNLLYNLINFQGYSQKIIRVETGKGVRLPWFIDETYYLKNDSNKFTQFSRAIRTLHGTLKTRSHNLNLIDNKICWENNNSKKWEYEFSSNEEAAEFWNKHIHIPIIKNQL